MRYFYHDRTDFAPAGLTGQATVTLHPNQGTFALLRPALTQGGIDVLVFTRHHLCKRKSITLAT